MCNQVLIMPARTQRNCAKGLRQVNFSLHFGRLGGKQELKPAAIWAHYCGVFILVIGLSFTYPFKMDCANCCHIAMQCRSLAHRANALIIKCTDV